jgi:hypothetical protein
MSQEENFKSLSKEEKEAKIKVWNQNEFVKIQKYCVSKGVEPKRIKQASSQVIPPVLGIWYMESTTKGEDYWIISGKLPTDMSSAKVAKNAREALRHFSMNWQLKAANLEAALAEGKQTTIDRETQEKYINELSVKAETIYAIAQDEKLWAEAGLKMS